MLEPKRTKYRKSFRGKRGGSSSVNNEVQFGEYGLKSIGRGWVNSREIESARRAVVGKIKRKGKVWIKIFPHKAVSQKPNNSKMGSGKGDVEKYVAVVKPGTMVLEISGVTEKVAREAFQMAANKLSVKTKFVERREF